jgi:ABC-type uncharacterized transport system permease subunit
MLVASFTAAALYLLIAGLRLRQYQQQLAFNRQQLLPLASLALVLHAYAAWAALQSPDGINLGFFKVSSLIFWVINLAFVISLIRRPLENLLLILFPLAALSVVTSALAPGNASPFESIPTGLLLHISSSVLAYAVLTIATCQAAVVALQDHQLRHRHAAGIVRALPPLQLMESMLFELLWVGLILLSLSIASGMLFLEDMFAQHLVHKTILTLAAWGLYALLLWGRHYLGWRSQTAVKLTLAGFAVLMLGYFGSKLVLELILQRA